MSPEPKRTNGVIEEILAEIDERSFIKTLTTVVSEVSPNANLPRIRSVLTLAVRCACLLDLYAETGNRMYLAEFENQRIDFYQQVPESFHPELEKTERQVKGFFDDERRLVRRIKLGDKFSKHDIEEYLLGKSGDNLFYGKLLELIVPEWNLTDELRIQTMLFDMGKDILDYDEDVKNGRPNVLAMCLQSGIDKDYILALAARLEDEALSSADIDASPMLKNSIKKNYMQVMERLGKLG